MSKLDPRIEAIREKYDLQASDFWELPQKKGTWVCKHAALEVVAVKAGIEFSLPQIIEASTAEGIAVLAVQGTLPADFDKAKGRSEWATGEASSKNNKNAYPWAMAEKRAKDRVVLKLSGIAGLVYSEDEADDFKEAAKPSEKPASGNKPQSTFSTHLNAIQGAKTGAELRAAWGAMSEDSSLSEDDYNRLNDATTQRKGQLSKPAGYVEPTFEGLVEK